ncbi:MAG: FHA domain-containing protein [Actinomycetota bacterium]|nr:FHA domain-containing protein [Actinomycetota bacterium]
MDLRVTGAGEDVTVPAGTTAVIGADSAASIKVARPGISRRHAVVKYDGSHWVVQDASSRNGTFHNGARIQSLDIKGPTTIRLGHPAEGAEIVLAPVAAASKPSTSPATPTAATQAAVPASTQRTRVAPATQAAAPGNVDPRLDDLVASLNDTVKSIRGLTWSVWAMIAVTAVLALLTLFVGIVGN